jgi:hypothetical protein
MPVSAGYLPVLYSFNRFHSLAIVKFAFENNKNTRYEKNVFPRTGHRHITQPGHIKNQCPGNRPGRRPLPSIGKAGNNSASG